MTTEQARASLRAIGESSVLERAVTDVARSRERARRSRLRTLAIVLLPIFALLSARAIVTRAGLPGLHLSSTDARFAPAVILIVLLAVVILAPMLGAGRSPHQLYRPSEIDVRFSDVRGAALVVDEAVKTLNLFLAHKTFTEQMGGTSRRAILFEGPPGTGKTHVAKAMAAEGGVPFLFVSASAFQSMFYGQTNRKIRSFFKALRKYARSEGGAIGFIEEIDAIGGARAGMGARSEGVSGVVNELLVQLQSFDQPPASRRLVGALVDRVNAWLPAARQVRKRPAPHANILVIGATNRAADLDPALVRPGRFDRKIYFDLPSRAGRREILDYYLAKKAHEDQLDDPVARDSLAAMTIGHSPVMLEHLLDEALVWALRRGADRLSWNDIQQAKMAEQIGLGNPVEYTDQERTAIATHEAGHATVAWLVGKGRTLDVLSIVKRGAALGLLLHSDSEERFTRTKSEIEALIQIAFGGMVAEELFFGAAGSGVAGDLKAATDAACQMVGSLGMGSSLISLDAVDAGLGRNLVTKVLASDHAREEVEEVLRLMKAVAREMLREHRHVVVALRDALLERHELVGGEILEVIAHAADVETTTEAAKAAS
ncbi:MAG TPA: AAA family ATPase [Acidimicrobiales bacterium]|nr:AAA family ATPase [Acidimicrobiales bacterium]